MTTLAELPLSRDPKILLYGEPATGKTCFVSSFGKGLQTIDCDDLMTSSLQLADKWQPDRKQIDVVQCHELDPTKAEAFVKVKKHLMDVTDMCRKGTYPYKVLSIDSFTSLGNFALRYIQYNSGVLNNPGLTAKTGTMSEAMWGLAIQELNILFTFIKALPIPVVVVFHTKTVAHPVTKAETEKISIFGKSLPNDIVGKFDHVVRVRVRSISGKPEPYLQTIPDAYTVARCSPNIPDGYKTSEGFKDFLTKLGYTP